jgi:hypothetical protein
MPDVDEPAAQELCRPQPGVLIPPLPMATASQLVQLGL